VVKAMETNSFRAGLVIPLWGVMVWVVLMNTSMFNIVLPSVIADLQVTPVIGSWIITGYSVVLAVATITYSRLADFIPIRRLLVFGMSLFGLASIIGYFAHHFSILLLARLLQAAGAGASQALGMVVAARYIPLARRGRAMSWIAIGASMAFCLGPVIGGVLAQYAGWNYLFVVSSIVLLLLPFFYKHLPPEQPQKIRFDVWGALLMATGTSGLLLFLTTLAETVYSYGFLLLSSLAYFLFWRHIQVVNTPFLQPALFRNRNYLKIVFMAFTNFATHFSTLFCLPILLAALFGKEPGAIGLIIFPGALIAAVAAILVGRFIDRFGTVPILVAAHGLLFVSMHCFAWVSGIDPLYSMLAYVPLGLGFFSMTSGLSNELTRMLPGAQVGAGLGMMQMTQFFGGAFGVTMSGFLISLQQSLPPKQIYQNIFLCFSGLVLCSGTLLGMYLRSKRKSSVDTSGTDMRVSGTGMADE
jgi:DHA2 family metal-tetracycline-proton antiporter-like MFS transporter